MSELPALLLESENKELSLSPEFLSHLQTREDYESAFGTISQQKNTCIWWEADIIYNYYTKFVGQHLDIYRAGQLMNNSTIKYYLRTASGFPPNTRIPSISFNHHYQSSFADEWNSKTLSFAGERRFQFAERAADEQMSTRHLKEIMRLDQEKKTKIEEQKECVHCASGDPADMYLIYKTGMPKTEPLKIYLHPRCYQEMMNFLIQSEDAFDL